MLDNNLQTSIIIWGLDERFLIKSAIKVGKEDIRVSDRKVR